LRALAEWRRAAFAAAARAPIASKRLPIVPVDSSAARMPRPGDTIAFAVAINSAAKGVFILGRLGQR
jgi:hypothetical protein